MARRWKYPQIAEARQRGVGSTQWFDGGMYYTWDDHDHWSTIVITRPNERFVVDDIGYRYMAAGNHVYLAPMITLVDDHGGAASMNFSAGEMTDEEIDDYLATGNIARKHIP